MHPTSNIIISSGCKNSLLIESIAFLIFIIEEGCILNLYHSYEQCLKDLKYSKEIVKPGGYIIGDDYGWPDSRWEKPGVTKAVNEFKSENNFKMLRHVQVNIQSCCQS